ncbi:MAG: DNA topoisomerase, partial [Candidatus Paceibacterota bacterium]
KILRTKVVAVDKAESVPNFSTNGSRILFPGWLSADDESDVSEVILPEISVGETLTLSKLESEGKETQPPARYSEAGLVKELEKRGIGRPSTYASIIQTLLTRRYVEKQERALVPTTTGEVVDNFLETNFKNIVSDSFTAKMEEDLDEIAEGQKDYKKTLSDFYFPFHKEVEAKDSLPKVTTLGDVDEKIKCPKCESKMVIKLARNGTFLSCVNFPECKGARMASGEEMKEPESTGEKCPECTSGNLVTREGKFGSFISCDKYPKCKYIKKDPSAKAQNSSGVVCPECKKGELVERRGRFGIFYSCSMYPKCKFSVNAKPTGKICTFIRDGKPCNALMVEGTKTIPERCSDKSCPNHNPHKLK